MTRTIVRTSTKTTIIWAWYNIRSLASTTELIGFTFVGVAPTFVDDSTDHIIISRYNNGRPNLFEEAHRTV